MSELAINQAGKLPVASAAETRREVGRAMRGQFGKLWASIVLLLGSAAAGLAAPAALGAMVDTINAVDSTQRVIWLGAAMLGGAIAQGGLLAIGLVMATRLVERLLADIRERMVGRALRLPQSSVERAGAGDLVSRATDDVAEVSEVAPRVVPAVGSAAFTILTTLVGMAVLDWRFAVAMLIVVPVHVLTVRWYLRTAPPVYRSERAANAEKASRLLGSLRGIDTVRAYRLSGREHDRIAVASWEVARWSLRARIVQNRFFGRLNFAEFLGLSAILFVAYWLVREDQVSVGVATTAVLFFLRLFDPINQLLFVFDDLQSAAASLARIVGVELAQSRTEASPTDVGPEALGAEAASAPSSHALVAIHDVDFEYEPGHPVLKGVSLAVEPEDHVALVGASGAGKSTVGALLAGLREPTRGSAVTRPDSFMISQDVHVFAGSLRDNLLLSAPDADDEQIIAALRQVGAEDLLLGLPDGLDTQVGHGGHEITAADAQHLALARVVLADPPVVILDEPSAEAGSAESAALDEAVSGAIDGRAALVIVHRLSQAAEASRIVVMSGGQVTETGSHDSLVADGAEYAGLWDAWQRGRARS